MRRAVTALAAALLLAGPAALAFFSGGYFTQPRLIAAIVAWLCVLALSLTGPAPIPCAPAGRVVVAAFAGLTSWTAASLAWAPLGGPAADALQRLLLYTGALLAGVGALRHPRARRAVEPALAAGALAVIGYGLAGRFLPGLMELSRSRAAGGRLEQPLTYWNAEGVMAAAGLVLCVRLAGDPSRSPRLRTAAAAAAPVLAAGLYITFSRGALVAAVLGLVLLVTLAPTREQLRAVAVAVVAGVAVALACAVLPGVASLEGTLPAREREGLVALAAVGLVAALSAVDAARRRGRAAHRLPEAWTRRLPTVAATTAVLIGAGLIVGGLAERPSQKELAAGADAGRLATVSSNRYEYWRVALEAAARDPLTGVGAGGFRVVWLEERSLSEPVLNVHSLELEIAAELGLPGLLLLLAAVGGIALSAVRAHRSDGPAAAGACAALATWLLHASIDWDWQLTAVTLPAVALAAALLVDADAARAGVSARPAADPAAPGRSAPAPPARDRSPA